MGSIISTEPFLLQKLLAINLPVVLVMLLIGVVVYRNDPNNKTNQWFFITFASFSLWMGIRTISDINETAETIFWDRLTFSVSVLMSVTFFHFATHYIKKSKVSKLLWAAVYAYPTFVIVFGTTTNWFIKKILIKSNGDIILDVSYLYTLNTVCIALTAIASLVLIVRKSRISALSRVQAKYVYIGLSSALVTNVANDFYFIISGRDIKTELYHPLTSAVGFLSFGVLVGYGVLKKRLFDVRGAAVRWLAYTLSLLAYSLFYGVLLSITATNLLNTNISNSLLVLTIALSVISALTFPVMKDVFNRFTNRIFFRNDFNSAVALATLNDALLGRNSIAEILSDCTIVLKETFHPEFLKIIHKAESGKTGFVRNGTHTAVDMSFTLVSTPWGTNDVLVINDPRITEMQLAYLVDENFEAALRLRTGELEVGAIVLGRKKNGDKYNKKDIEFLNAALKNVNLALKTAVQFNHIQNFNATLRTEVQEATKKLKQTNSQITKISKAKDEMISMVSHQLIPQLTATQGFIEILEQTDDNKDEVLKLSRSATARMTRLAQDMLNSTKIQAGELELERELLDIVSLVRGEVKDLSYAAAKHEVVVVVNAPDRIMIEVDKIKFGEALFNIIDNAIQYSPKQRQVVIDISPDSIRVSDHGIGISKSELPNIAKKYYRTKNARKRRPNGSGIGLFVTANIIKKHGFTFVIDSKAHIGTTVVIGIKHARTI